MNQALAIFSVQGSIWLNKKQNKLYTDNNIIEIKNTRNSLKDWDKIGETGGNCPDPGWYSLTLANIERANANAVQIGDILKLRILSYENNNEVLYDLGNYTVAKDDIELGGAIIDFDLNQGT